MQFTKEKIKDAIENGIIYPDGHTIIAPDHYEGFDVTSLTVTHRSDFSSPKSTIFGPDGSPQESVEGVHNLDFLDWVARRSGVKYTPAYGRGSEARNIVNALVQWSNAIFPDDPR